MPTLSEMMYLFLVNMQYLEVNTMIFSYSPPPPPPPPIVSFAPKIFFFFFLLFFFFFLLFFFFFTFYETLKVLSPRVILMIILQEQFGKESDYQVSASDLFYFLNLGRGLSPDMSVISYVLASCPSVTVKKMWYEGLAPPWKLSHIVEIRFFRKVQGTTIFGPCCQKLHFYQNVRPLREQFHISHKD